MISALNCLSRSEEPRVTESQSESLSEKNLLAVQKILQGGVFLVTVHAGTIVQIARVERPLVLKQNAKP